MAGFTTLEWMVKRAASGAEQKNMSSQRMLFNSGSGAGCIGITAKGEN